MKNIAFFKINGYNTTPTKTINKTPKIAKQTEIKKSLDFKPVAKFLFLFAR